MNGSPSWIVASKLLAVIVLVLANGFFVAAEFALVAVRRSRVEQLIAEGHPQARTLQRAVIHLDSYLAATQLGVTMSSLGLGWLGEPALAVLIEPAFHSLPKSLATISSHTVSVVIAFTIITALHIVLGELAPKSLALQRTEGTALAIVRPLELYLSIFRPAVHILNNLGNLVLRLLGLKPGSGEELFHSTEELKLLVAASRKAGLLGEAEQDVVERVFRLGDRRISAFMIPRTEIIWLDIDDSLSQLRHKITESIHSRFPVSQGSIDHLLGIVQAKQFLAANLTSQSVDLKALLLQPLYVPESMRALRVLELFKKSGNHMAMIVDEYGVIQGLVTLNDILEAIVGDFPSANEPEESQAIQQPDGSWLLDGMLSIEEFKEIFNLRKLSEGEGINYQTLGGFVMMQLGDVPATADQFEWENLRFEVMDMDAHRVDKVLVTPVQVTSDR